MTGHQKSADFALVPSGEANIFHLTVEGRYIGTIASDGNNLSTSKPWGWRLLIGNGTLGDVPLTGRSHNIDEALAEAKHAYERHRDMLSHRM